MLGCDDKFNVIPAQVSAVLDGRLLPGFSPEHLLGELRAGLGDDVDLEVLRFDPGAAEPDMSLFPTLAGILERADPGSTATPPPDAGRVRRALLRPPRYPDIRVRADEAAAGVRLLVGVHGADERIPADAIDFGADAVHEALRLLRVKATSCEPA